jgi:hypothetical protein
MSGPPKGREGPGQSQNPIFERHNYEIATDIPARHRVQAAFDQLTMAI